MTWIDGGALWVGRHRTVGLVVYDNTDNGESEFVTLFYVNEDRFASVRRSMMREGTTGNGIAPAEAQNAALRFHSFPVRQRQRELDEKNRAFLERLGKAAAGTRPRSNQHQPRATHCYACHGRLESTIEFECMGCGWLLCQCGACGCGYVPYKSHS